MGQLNGPNKLKIALKTIGGIDKSSSVVEAGSSLLTNKENFYLVISAEILLADIKTYYTVSPASPIGLKLKG
jgi:hypothetical protein